MNRTQRRRTEALARRSVDRSEAIALAYEAIAAIDDPDLAGGTQFLPDGTSMFISAADARAMMAGKIPVRGRA